MNRTIFAMALICMGSLCMSSAQASFYPPQIEKICQPRNDGSEYESCLHARIAYLEKLLKPMYAMAYANSHDKKLLEREQRIFEHLRKPGQDQPLEYEEGEGYNALLNRVLELAVSLYPEPVFPQDVINECKKEERDDESEPWDCQAKQVYVQSEMEVNYELALSNVQDKRSLETNQQNWLRETETICDFGHSRFTWEMENSCIYFWNLLRANQLGGIAKEGKIIPSSLDLALAEVNHGQGALASSLGNHSNPFSPRAEAPTIGSTEPSIDLTDVANVKRIQKALSGIYKWIPTKSDDLAAMHYAAIHDFQERNGLPVSNTITRSLLTELESAAYRRQQEDSEKIFLDFDSPKYVMKTQDLLRQVGYNVPTNGVLDPQTENAIRDFQSKNGVKVSGKVGPFLIQQLEHQAHVFGLDDPLSNN